MKFIITAVRNNRELDAGWSEEELSRYMARYVQTYGVIDRMKTDFPEFDITVEVT